MFLVLLYFIGRVTKLKAAHESADKNRPIANGRPNKAISTSLSAGNMVMFVGLNLGWGLMVMFYSMEWYSRINCPNPNVRLVPLQQITDTVLVLRNRGQIFSFLNY